jgi:hypothetical protein
MKQAYTAHAAAAAAKAAVLDAARLSTHNQAAYKPVEVARAVRLMQQLKQCYNSIGYYTSYRKNFVALKVRSPFRIADAQQLAQLERFFSRSNFSKVVTPQGVIYRIPKI